MKVLFVDDDAVLRKLGEFALGRFGDMTVVTAANGREALSVAIAERPDAILMDFMMPGMNGDEALVELKSCPDTADIPVVFLSGIDDPAQIDEWIAAGAAGALAKPFDPTTLAGDLEETLRSSAAPGAVVS